MKLHQNIEVMKELIEIISARSNVSVEVLEKDYYVTLILKELSEFEKQVFELHLTGMTYTEIAKVLGRDEKSTDNALQRMKAKIKRLLK